MPTEKTCQYWLEVTLHYAETRLSVPQYEECKASLTTTARAEAAEAELTAAKTALTQSKIIGIYDEFHCLADAIEQLTHYVKELESYKDRLEIGKQAAEADRDHWREDAERLAGVLRAVEWVQDNYWSEPLCYQARLCPWCGGGNEYPFDDEPPIHRPNCQRHAALAAHDAADGDGSGEE